MMTRAGTVPLSDLQFLKIYFNKRRLRSTTANLKKMLAEAGGDAICNGSIFLRNQLGRFTRPPITGHGPSAGTPRQTSA